MRTAIALLITALVACSPATIVTSPRPPTPPPSVTASPAPPTSQATAAPTTQTTAPTPTPIVDLAQVFHPLTIGWQPTATTLLFSVNGAKTSILTALAIGPKGALGPAVPLVEIAMGPFDVRPDGGAVAIGVAVGGGTRIATYDIRTGTATWVTPIDDAFPFPPVWSKDGTFLYYAGPTTSDYKGTVLRIRADGSGKTQIAALDRFGDLRALSPDGRYLIWSRGQEGGSADLLEIATGTDHDLADVAGVVSWRAQQPRILLHVGGCCAGRPGGSLIAFDDSTMTSHAIAERSPGGAVEWSGGAWDPSGTKIAAGRYDNTTPYDASLVIIDETGAVRPVPDMTAIRQILWLDEGIVVTRGAVRQLQTDLVLVPVQSGSPILLYQGSAIVNIRVVRP